MHRHGRHDCDHDYTRTVQGMVTLICAKCGDQYTRALNDDDPPELLREWPATPAAPTAIREPGFYWVRISADSEWSVAEYDTIFALWHIPGSSITYGDDEFEEINEQRIER